MTERTNYFPQLTGLRAIAAYLIYLHHFPFPQTVNLTNQLQIGVGIFFTLSGFLIYYRYANTFENTKLWWHTYIINRIARIYPLYFILTVLTLALRDGSLLAWITNLTFTRGFFDELKFTGIAQGWTLTVEECFYFSAPLIFLMLRRNKFWLSLFIIFGVGLLLNNLGQYITSYGFFGNFFFTATYTFFGRALDFFIGMYVAQRFLAANSLSNPEAESGKSLPWATVISISGIIAVILVRMWLEVSRELPYTHPLAIGLNNLVYPVFYALLLWGLLSEKTWLSRILGTQVMVLLGKSSYAFYLIHIGVISGLVKQNLQGMIFNPYSVILLHFIAMNIISIGLYQFVEAPLNHFIRSRMVFRKLSLTTSQ